MGSRRFFDEPTERSQVKTHIVNKYFHAWARVIIPHVRTRGRKLAYIDLFCGPGRYEDGTPSTPLLVLQQAVGDKDLCDMLVTLLNDRNQEYADKLVQEINSLEHIRSLRYQPKVSSFEVGEDIARLLEEVKLVPTLFFIDPWGYKGVSLRLINAALSNWGCDCIFFFNYTRIRAALNNPASRQHMEGLFGEQRLSALVRKLEQSLPPHVREVTVMEALSQALREGHGQYVLPFRFVDDRGTRTSHHVVFVTKHPRGYGIMKDIMAKESSSSEQGVPTFEYNPATARQPLLFELSRPLDDLPGMLLDAFAGQTLTMVQVYERHHVGRRFVKANYKAVLRELEEGGTILVIPPKEQRPKRRGDVTFADKVLVTFPSR